MELRYPKALWDPLPDAGVFTANVPWRGCLHTTEGRDYDGARASYVANRSAPHFTVEWETDVPEIQVRQHMGLDCVARALKNPPGGVETNAWRVVQIEVVGFAAEPVWLPQLVVGVRDLMIWIEQQTDIKPIAPRFYGPGEGFILARATSPVRFKSAEWKVFNGWCGHQHVPENDHWDPGTCPITALLVRPSAPTPPPGAPMANAPFAVLLTYGDRGYLQIGEDGGVFAWDAPFFGSLGGLKLEAPVIDACWTPTKRGYWMLAEDGGVFAFGDAQAHGNLVGIDLGGRPESIAATDSGGYIIGAHDGGVFPFGPGAVHRGNALWSG